jgi:hypothetical protein
LRGNLAAASFTRAAVNAGKKDFSKFRREIESLLRKELTED